MQAIIFSKKICKTEWGPVYFLHNSVDYLIRFSYLLWNLFFSLPPGGPATICWEKELLEFWDYVGEVFAWLEFII